MFGTQFYPTPDDLADRMVAPYADREWSGHFKVLDPSAGSGSLLSAIERALGDRKGLQLSGIELDPELTAMTRGKGFRCVTADWLEHRSYDQYDLIVMNPPFRNGCKHVNKAYLALKQGGDLVALLNATNIRDPKTDEHKRTRRIIEEHGTVQYLRDAFSDAQRKTDVEVALVYLTKPKPVKTTKEKPLFEPDGMDYRKVLEMEADPAETELATLNEARNLVLDYEASVMAFVEFKKAERRYNRYQRRATGGSGGAYEGGNDRRVLDQEITELTRKCWDRVLGLSKVKKRMGSSATRQFDQMVSEQYGLAFTEANIYKLLQQLIDNSADIAKKSVLDAYDTLTKYSTKNLDPENRWKTNNAFRINKRVILPVPIGIDSFGGWQSSLYYEYRGAYVRDLDIALCHLAGKGIEHIVSVTQALDDAIKPRRLDLVTGKTESTFFNIRFFKKGTAHLTFKDLGLLDRFNCYVATERGWLQEGERVKKGALVVA